MSDDPVSPALMAALLGVAAQGPLVAPDAEAGVARLSELAAIAAPPVAWHEAVAHAVRDGTIHDPVQLPPGALQCHWRLELTPAGRARVAEAGSIRTARGA